MRRVSTVEERQSTAISAGLHLLVASIAVYASNFYQPRLGAPVFDQIEVIDTQQFNALLDQNRPAPIEATPDEAATTPTPTPTRPLRPVTAVTPENLPAPIFDPNAQNQPVPAPVPAPEQQPTAEAAPPLAPAPEATPSPALTPLPQPAPEPSPPSAPAPAPAPAPTPQASLSFARPAARDDAAIAETVARIAALTAAEVPSPQPATEPSPVQITEPEPVPAPAPEAISAPAPAPAPTPQASLSFARPAARNDAAIAESAARVAAAQEAAQQAAAEAASAEAAQQAAAATPEPTPTPAPEPEQIQGVGTPTTEPAAEPAAEPPISATPAPAARPESVSNGSAASATEPEQAPAKDGDVVDALLADVLAGESQDNGGGEVSRIEQGLILQKIRQNWVTSALVEKDNFARLVVTVGFVTNQSGNLVGDIALIAPANPDADFAFAFDTAKNAILRSLPLEMPANTPADGLAWRLKFDPAANSIDPF